jgi:hypothetical protein
MRAAQQDVGCAEDHRHVPITGGARGGRGHRELGHRGAPGLRLRDLLGVNAVVGQHPGRPGGRQVAHLRQVGLAGRQLGLGLGCAPGDLGVQVRDSRPVLRRYRRLVHLQIAVLTLAGRVVLEGHQRRATGGLTAGQALDHPVDHAGAAGRHPEQHPVIDAGARGPPGGNDVHQRGRHLRGAYVVILAGEAHSVAGAGDAGPKEARLKRSQCELGVEADRRPR